MKKYIEKRPWGKFEQFAFNERCTVKILTLKKNEELSLQYHNKREEFWKILDGGGEVLVASKTKKGKEGDEFLIPKKTIHQMKAGKEGIKVLEISFGKFLEKDEIRIKDKYKRKKK